MGRAPCCSKVGLHKGPWSTTEDKLLTDYIQANGEGQWRSLPKKAGLLRCGKSCRLRWMNYLKPGIKRGNITADEEDLIIRLQALLGNRWSLIAKRLPGRTDNEIKNHWNTHLLRRLKIDGIETKKSHKPSSKKSINVPKKSKSKKKLNRVNHNDTTAIISSTEDDRDDEKVSSSSNTNNNNNITKVHIPKPIKICSESTASNSSGSVASGNTNKSSSNQQEEDQEEAKTSPQVSDISWSLFELDDQSFERRIEISDENQILFYDDCDLFLQEAAPLSDSLLDMVYDEYLQLL